MFKRFYVILLLLVCTLALMPVHAQTDDALEDLTFALTFIPNIQFSPLYVAIEQGYFAEAGLVIDIEYGDENVLVDLIAADQLYFATISGEQVIMARAGDRPVVYVYEWFQEFPVGIVIPDTTPAASVDDLHGRRVGIPGRFGASYSGLIALLAAYDMTEQDIALEPIGFNAPDVICLGGVEASVVYVNNEPLQIQQRADSGQCGDITSVEVIPVAADVDIVSNGIVTSEALIASNPELVRAVVLAFHLGLRDVINNPAEAYLLSLTHVENLPVDAAFQAALEGAAEAQREFLATGPDRAAIAQSREDLYAALAQDFPSDMLIQFQVLLATIPLWDADMLGVTDPASWVVTQDVLLMMDALSGEIDLESAYSNAFVPGTIE